MHTKEQKNLNQNINREDFQMVGLHCLLFACIYFCTSLNKQAKQKQKQKTTHPTLCVCLITFKKTKREKTADP